MNPEIDLKHFSNTAGTSAVSDAQAKQYVSPPRRIVTRYVFPLALLASFAAVGAYSFRGALVRRVDVQVTMPVPAPEQLVTQALAAGFEAKSTAVPERTASEDPSSGVPGNEPAPLAKGAPLFQAPGWIEPSPYPIVIPALRSGTVESLEVIEGQEVSSGTVIARLINEDAVLALDSAKSTLKLKQANFEAARSQWENPVSLVESVATANAKGAQLAAQAQRLRDHAELAQLEAKVGSTLSRGGYEASLETVRKQTELSASRNQLMETQAEIRLNSATLTAASDRLRLRIEDRQALDTASAELLEAQTALAAAQLHLDRSVIKAPTSGTIMRMAVTPGSMLSGEMAEGMTIAVMYKPDMLQVRVDVPLAEAAKVRPGLPAEVRVEALPDRRFRGELVNIVPQFDLQKNVLPVKVRLYDPDKALRPEMIARVEFQQEAVKPAEPVKARDIVSKDKLKTGTGTTSRSAVAESAPRTAGGQWLVIPSETLLPGSTATAASAMVVGPDNVAQPRVLTLASKAGDMALITSGLQISDKIVLEPGKVSPGNLVRITGVVDHAAH